MDMTKVDFTNSYDEKIMNWDKKSFEELVGSMTIEEIEGMAGALGEGFGLGFEIDLYYEDDANAYPYEVVYNYIKRWLYAQIEEGIQTGTRELFEIVMAI